MSQKLLDVRKLSIGLNDVKGIKVVKGISFSMEKGKVTGLVGESGSGKSITSLALMQLLPPPLSVVSGNIMFSGRDEKVTDLVSLPEEKVRKLRGREISMIFQEPMTSLNPSFTCGFQVREVVAKHLGLKGREADQRVMEWLERVKLPQPSRAYHSYPHQLSGGQRQRVMIAMAMCCNPSLLIADEPTTALDVTVQKKILELMLELQQQFGMGILFITHDLGVVNDVADEVMVMFQGEIVERGSVGKVLENPDHPYTKGLLGCRPPTDRKLTRLPVMRDFFKEGKEQEGDLITLLNDRKIDASEIEARHKKIYAQPPLLEVKNLKTDFVTKRNFFGKPVDWYPAVKEVSFSLYSGETLGLVGESGCGKTTLGRSILQLVKDSSGDILFNGKPLQLTGKKDMKSFRKKIQIIFQDPYSSLNPGMTAGEIIMEPMLVHGIGKSGKDRRERARVLLEQVGLPEAAFGRYPHQFSGGQRQRIGIARALAMEPEIIICDESVSALDMSVQAQVLNLLNDLKEKYNLTYLFISHNLSVVKYMSDRIMVMKNGKIEEEGDAIEVFEHPKSEYTKQLIDAIPGSR